MYQQTPTILTISSVPPHPHPQACTRGERQESQYPVFVSNSAEVVVGAADREEVHALRHESGAPLVLQGAVRLVTLPTQPRQAHGHVPCLVHQGAAPLLLPLTLARPAPHQGLTTALRA